MKLIQEYLRIIYYSVVISLIVLAFRIGIFLTNLFIGKTSFEDSLWLLLGIPIMTFVATLYLLFFLTERFPSLATTPDSKLSFRPFLPKLYVIIPICLALGVYSEYSAITKQNLSEAKSAENARRSAEAQQRIQEKFAERLSAMSPQERESLLIKNINFDSSEAQLMALAPSVKCEQMPNPEVRMCRFQTGNAENISFLFYSNKLININGRTKP